MLKCSIIGNLGSDAQIKKVGENEFVSFNVAHTRKYIINGSKVEETCWVSVTVNWDCSKILPFLLKGTKVFVRGNIRLRVYTGHDGQQHAGLTIIAEDIELCSSKKPDTSNNEPISNDPPF